MTDTKLREALQGLLSRYVRLVESGDAGNWDAEAEPEVIAAREALAAPAAEPEQSTRLRGGVPQIDYTPGTWYEAKDRDDLQAFFLSRLPVIREAAREHGYAIGLHGSLRRDMDLIAVPWRDGASDKDVLAHAIAMAACGITRDGPYQWEQKPLGRVAASLSCCWPRWFNEAGAGHIDLSVMGPLTAAPQAPALDAGVVRDERDAFEAWYCEDAAKSNFKFTPDQIAAMREGEFYGAHRANLNGKWEGWQARAALTAAKAGGWVAVEQAPKHPVCQDGNNHYSEYILAWWPGAMAPTRCRWWFRDDSDACNFIADGGYAVFPTVFQPLPAPPA